MVNLGEYMYGQVIHLLIWTFLLTGAHINQII